MKNKISNAATEFDERLAALHSNTNAIKALASAVEGTLGPKGLDTMLVDSTGEIVITNDGVTILNKMEVDHPAAKMLIQVARAQQQEIGDGTTTATVLASELLSEAVSQVNKGVPVPKVIEGIKQGITIAISSIKKSARPITVQSESLLKQIAFIAGREHEDIAKLIVKAAKLIGSNKLLDSSYRFADSIIAHEGYDNELVSGLIINKSRMNPQMPSRLEGIKLLIIQDGFEPEDIDDEAMGTELGFSKYLEYKEVFKENLIKLKALGINLIAVDRGVDPLAEEFCVDQGIMVIQRLASQELKLLATSTGAKTIKRTGLHKSIGEIKSYLGTAELAYEDEKLQKIRVIAGKDKEIATILVGASTGEIVDELERIAKDAAASIQAAIKGGYVPGGGAIEVAVARELELMREQIKGLEGFGLQAVANSLRKPMVQIILNAGFNPLEKLQEVKLAQVEQQKDSIGINTDTGQLLDMEEAGIIDPALIKMYALKAAMEIAVAILRIHTIIKMKKVDDYD